MNLEDKVKELEIQNTVLRTLSGRPNIEDKEILNLYVNAPAMAKLLEKITDAIEHEYIIDALVIDRELVIEAQDILKAIKSHDSNKGE